MVENQQGFFLRLLNHSSFSILPTSDHRNNEEAKLWLLEDEYERVEGRLTDKMVA